jgi:hypothetical protein
MRPQHLLAPFLGPVGKTKPEVDSDNPSAASRQMSKKYAKSSTKGALPAKRQQDEQAQQKDNQPMRPIPWMPQSKTSKQGSIVYWIQLFDPIFSPDGNHWLQPGFLASMLP